MRRTRALALILVLGLLWLAPSAAQAQDKTLYAARRDVDVTILTNSDLRFTENWDIVFTSGIFRYGFYGIKTDKLDRITDIEVWEGDRRYRSGSGDAYAFETFRQGDEFTIKWYFPPTRNASRTFTLKYTVVGGLRIYDGGDQFWWKAVDADRAYPVGSSRVTVHLPASFSESELKIATYGPESESDIVDGRTVVFTANDISPGQAFEVRVQFPHGVVKADPPSWQASADQQKAYDETWRPVATLGLGLLGLLILVGGGVGLYLLWYSRGRDVPVGPIADYIAELPDDLPPGVVGTLLDEHADMQDIVATIVDLARRGVIKMTETQEPGFLGIGTHRDYVLELLDVNQDLRDYERTLIEKLFGGRTTVELSSLKEKFYTAVPELKDQMYEEVVKAGFFHRSPESTRKRYTILGIVGLVLSGVVGFCALPFLSQVASTAICLPLGLGIVAAALTVLGRFMPRKTPEGATAAAKWQAFRRYLADIEKYTDLEEAKDVFDRYLPYAISFGLERRWVAKFTAVDTPAPTWYETYPPVFIPGGGYRMGRARGGSVFPAGMGGEGTGGGEGGGRPSLQRTSESLGRSLQGMSDGLFSMLNATSTTLASAPRSSGGGGGWSGGGFSGGGGGGGGSSGFG